MKNSRNETEIEKLFITTCEKILIALLEEPLQNNVLAKRVGITQQHLSRLLPKLQRNGLITSHFLNVRRINSLTTKGKILAELALQKKKAVKNIRSTMKESRFRPSSQHPLGFTYLKNGSN